MLLINFGTSFSLIWELFGTHLGTHWGGFGSTWGALGLPKPQDWRTKRHKNSTWSPLMCQERVQVQFWLDFDWIWEPRWLQNRPQKGFKPSQNHSPEPTQYSAFRIMHSPLPITPLPGPAGWAQPLNPPCACRTGRVKRGLRSLNARIPCRRRSA